MKYSYLFFILLVVMMFFSPSAPSAKNVTDQLGRKLELPDNPRRVVALAPSITEIIFALGRTHLLKGATQFSDFPPGAEKIPRVGSYVRLDLEKIVALRPDLCIAIKDGNPREIIQRLESLKISVYVVDPHDLDSVMKTIQEIGRLLDAGESAETLVGDMKLRILRIKSLIAKTDQRPRVFFQIGIAPIVSAGTDTFIHELIVLAGGKNLAEGPVSYPRFSREQVIGLSPEVFIITSMARSAVFEQVKTEWSRWPNLPAVQNERIFLVDSNLFDRPTPRLLDGLERLAQLIHPEIFEPEAFKLKTIKKAR